MGCGSLLFFRRVIVEIKCSFLMSYDIFTGVSWVLKSLVEMRVPTFFICLALSKVLSVDRLNLVFTIPRRIMFNMLSFSKL
jgi:hypothetical protein